MTRTLKVALLETPVGDLVQTDAGRLQFRYDAAWIEERGSPLSISLPVQSEPFGHRATEPFFGGLLPEEGVRERVARYLGVTAHNDFALLEQIGGECAGAVTLTPVGPDAESDVANKVGAVAAPAKPPHPLEDKELAQLLDDLPRRPLLAGGERRLSLAGAQDKVAVILVDDRLALPTGTEPSTHILKTPIQGFDGTVPNELLCMRTAAAIGLAVAPAERRVASGREFLLVERFDRVRSINDRGRGTIQRIHQEDLCQALGVPTRLKYQSEGGPSLPDCFGLLTRHSRRPAVDRLALIRATAFNYLVGNCDAHAKNFSLQYSTAGLRLAPLYDLLSTLAYPDLSPRYAMKIGSKAAFRDIRGRHWSALAEASGLAPAQLRREVLTMARTLPAALAQSAETEDFQDLEPAARRVVDSIVQDTTQRCELTEVRLKEQ